jgi:hypothetical protein
VELLHGGVRGAELEKREQSSPKHALKLPTNLRADVFLSDTEYVILLHFIIHKLEKKRYVLDNEAKG